MCSFVLVFVGYGKTPWPRQLKGDSLFWLTVPEGQASMMVELMRKKWQAWQQEAESSPEPQAQSREREQTGLKAQLGDTLPPARVFCVGVDRPVSVIRNWRRLNYSRRCNPNGL